MKSEMGTLSLRVSLAVKLLLLCGGLDLVLGALAHLLTQRRLPLEAGWEEWAEAQRTVWAVVGLGLPSALAWAYLLWRLSWARHRVANARPATWWLPGFRRLGTWLESSTTVSRSSGTMLDGTVRLGSDVPREGAVPTGSLEQLKLGARTSPKAAMASGEEDEEEEAWLAVLLA